ncbi:MAG: hypothetical protein WA908_07550 [Pontixanthobacter sp.]
MTKQPDPRAFCDAASALPDHDLHHNGWTPAKQAAFLRELSASHNVTAAARAVGMSRQSAYKLRMRLRGEPFDAAWKAAFATRFDVLAETALDRALNGVEVPHYYNGELIGTSRRYDERLTLALLAARGNFASDRDATYHSASAFRSDDLAGLIERVGAGPEEWRESADAELVARYGEGYDDEDVLINEGAGPSPDGVAPNDQENEA